MKIDRGEQFIPLIHAAARNSSDNSARTPQSRTQAGALLLNHAQSAGFAFSAPGGHSHRLPVPDFWLPPPRR